MARFKLGETARRLLALAEGAGDRAVRARLIEMSGMLQSQQRKLGGGSRSGKGPERTSDVEELWPPVRRAG